MNCSLEASVDAHLEKGCAQILGDTRLRPLNKGEINKSGIRERKEDPKGGGTRAEMIPIPYKLWPPPSDLHSLSESSEPSTSRCSVGVAETSSPSWFSSASQCPRRSSSDALPRGGSLRGRRSPEGGRNRGRRPARSGRFLPPTPGTGSGVRLP